MDQYPRTTTFTTVGVTYIGFQTRPGGGGAYSLLDAGHANASGGRGATDDCSQCHTVAAGFGAPSKGVGHIPVNANASCGACHKNPDFKVMPAITDIHNANNVDMTSCKACHADTTTYPMTPVITAPPTGHIAQGASQDCKDCHVGPNSSILSVASISNGSNFKNSAYVHSGPATGCDTCHGTGAATANLYGVVPKNIATLAPGHLPINSGAACEACHKTAPGSTQVPLTGAIGGSPSFAGAIFNHSYTSATCASCHGQGMSGSSFAGSPNILVMPSSAAPSDTSHIPTTAACEVCHGSTYPVGDYSLSATKSVPGSGFQALRPTPAQIHNNSSASCSTCHEVGSWVSVGPAQYPRTTTSPYVSGAYFGFQVRPTTSGAGQYSIQDNTPHPVSGECSDCHSSYVGGFAAPVKPAGHIPVITSGCASCHKDPSYKVMPAIADIHNASNIDLTQKCQVCHADTTTYPMVPVIKAPPTGHIAHGVLDCKDCHVGSNSSILSATVITNGSNFRNSAYVHDGTGVGCDTCHGSGAATANLFGVVPKNIATLAPGHLPIISGTACESCHKASPGITQVPSTGAIGGSPTFAGATFNHNATTASCATCHGQGVSGTSFAGNPSIIVMPQSSAPGTTSHLPSTADCQACHTVKPSGDISANAPATTTFKSALPTPANIHANVSTGCSGCHESGTWLGMDLPLYKANPTGTTYVSGTAYHGFQTRPTLSGGLNAISDPTPHPATGECSNCHGSYSASGFVAPAKPAGHIPTVTSGCASCHTSSDYSVMPAIVDIHNPSNIDSSSCKVCHANTTTYPMSPVIKAPPTGHVDPGTLDCQDCHVGPNSSLASTTIVNGANFQNSAYVHNGTATCASCHGSGAAPIFGVVPKNIASLTPGHLSVSVKPECGSCHTAPGATQYPVSGAISGMPTFAGGTFNHDATNASCAACHGQSVKLSNFAGNPTILLMPQSSIPGTEAHIPTTAACDVCHGSAPTGSFDLNNTKSVGASGFRTPAPGTQVLHANVSASCSTCHESGKLWAGVEPALYPRDATFPGTPPYKGFQTRPNLSGFTYSLPDGSHPASGECSGCHSVAAGFGPVAKPTNHIPVTTAGDANCSLCHKSADYSVMPSLSDIHTNSSKTLCSDCHTTTNAAKYPMTPSIMVPPTNHIDQGSSGCADCHVGTGSSMTSATPVPDGALFKGSLFNHSGIAVACAICHGSAVPATGFYGVVPKAISNLQPKHMPTSDTCTDCHINSLPTGLVPATGMKTFAGAQFSHSGITSGCETCHGPNIVQASFAGSPKIVVMPATSPFGPQAHIPSSTTCETCHIRSVPTGLLAGSASKLTGPGTGFQVSPPVSSETHAGVSGNCSSCHGDGQQWIGMSLYPSLPSTTYVAHTNYSGFQTRPGAGGPFAISDSTHPGAGLDCSNCHSSFTSFGPLSLPNGHIPVASSSSCGDCHTNFSVPPTSLTAIHAKAPTPTTNCVQCHDATAAQLYSVVNGKPIVNPIKVPSVDHVPMLGASCEKCHMGPNSSIKGGAVKDGDKFAGSLFDHNGVSTGCDACHGVNVDGTTFIGLPNIKAITLTGALPHLKIGTNGCEVCHTNSVPVGQVPAAGMKTFANGSFTHANNAAACNVCHVPSPGVATFLGSPVIVGMPQTTTPGSQAHIPSSTTCESCHTNSVPAGLVAGNATKPIGSTGFKNQLPDSATIHANSDTTSCNVCHESGKDWASVSTYTRGPQNTPLPGTLFTGFQTRPIAGGGTYSVIDANHVAKGVGDCSNCHTGFTGFGPPTAPTNHIPYSSANTTTCGSCHKSADYSVFPAYADIHKNAQSYTTNCVQCHSTTNAATYNQLSGMANKLVSPATTGNVHIPMAGLSCETCHVDSLTGLTTTTTSFAGSKYSHQGVTTGCNACHVSGTGPFQGTLNIIVMPATTPATSASHLPTSTTCETCHSGSTPTGVVPAVSANTAATSTFGSPVPTAAMNHTGVTGSCSTCHDVGGTGTSDVWMNMAAYQSQTNANGPAPYKGFQTRPNSAGGTFKAVDAIHPTSGDCSACHTSFTDFSAVVLPANHIPTSTLVCTNCHTGSNYTTMPSLTNIHKYAPTNAQQGNCQLCHSATNAATYMQLAGLSGKLKFPVNVGSANGHVDMAGLDCVNCHVGTGSSIAANALPVQNNAVFTNSAYIHTGVTSNCAKCHGDGVTALTFLGQAPKPIPTNHVPNSGSQDCVACHLVAPAGLVPYAGAAAGGSQTFATTNYSHKGITATCQTCHASGTYLGITNMVVLSNFSTHIPTTLATATKPDCVSCHASSTPSALVTWTKGAAPKAAPNTGFGLKTQIPTGAAIHAGVTSGCIGCHESTYSAIGSWLEVDTSYYNRTPTVKTSGASYLGFNTRPIASGTGYSIPDANHPTTGDCSNCHGSTASFAVTAVPTNHIPYLSTATCDKCHTNINLVAGNADFSQVPTLVNIHAYAPSSTTNCAQCHDSANATKYNAGGVVIKSPASIAKHVPYGTVACETCHVGLSPVVNTSKFAGGQFSHSGITTGCATCHGGGLLANNFTGITNLVAIPTTATMGATSHIPYTAACETCHAGTGAIPTALLPVTGTPAVSTGFRTPVPTSANIHGTISSGCNACHDSNYVWKGMDLYPINPNAITTNGSYTGFQTRPLASPVTTALGKFGITDSAHPTTGDCSQCHGSTTAFSGVAKPAGHMTTTAACSACHSATDYSVVGLGLPTKLTTLHSNFSPSVTATAIVPATAANMASQTCGSCHSTTASFAGCATSTACSSPPPTNWQAANTGLHPVHVPIGTSTTLTADCSACHASVTSFSGVNMKNATMHTSVNSMAKVLCMSCHDNNLAGGKTPFYGITSIKQRPSGHHTGVDCAGSSCHTYNGGFRALAKPVMRGALVSPDMGRIKPNTLNGKPTRGSLGNSFDHKGVAAGKCKDCHDGKSASGMPARHLMVSTSCDTCHRPTTWLPAQFNHSGITPNTCLACHNGLGASAKPSGHFMTSRSCDSCHKSLGWTPVNYQHMSPLYKASPDKLTCISCHDTNGEIIRRQARALTRTKPIPVGP